jgi:hypothetical protein
LALALFGPLFWLTSSVCAEVGLFILSGCCLSSSLAIPMASTSCGARNRNQRNLCNLRISKLCGFLALFDGNEGAGLWADVLSIGADQFVIRPLLLDVSGPARDSRHHEKRGEMCGRNA